VPLKSIYSFYAFSKKDQPNCNFLDTFVIVRNKATAFFVYDRARLGKNMTSYSKILHFGVMFATDFFDIKNSDRWISLWIWGGNIR
jgi:hypothetical protein